MVGSPQSQQSCSNDDLSDSHIPPALLGVVVAFAGWTLICHVAAFTRLSFTAIAPLLWLCVTAAFVLAVDRARTQSGGSHDGPILVLALAVAGTAVTLISHRPNIDDSFYLSVASHALSHPAEAALSGDTLYGDAGGLPLLLPVYKVQSFELLSASIAWTFGFNPATAYYVIVPSIFAFVLPFAWATILQILAPSSLRVGLITLFLLMLVAGEVQWSIGNFAYVRMFQGKTVLVSVFVPLIYAQAWRFSQTGFWRDWLFLAAVIVGAIGCSSTALFIAPCALGLALASCLVPARTHRALIGATIALYPLVLALSLRSQTAKALKEWLIAPPSTLSLMYDFFGPHQIYILLGLTFLAGLGVADPLKQRWLALLAALYLIGPANPIFAGLIAERVTSAPLYWRILWIVPWPVFVALGLAGAAKKTSDYWPFSAAPAVAPTVILIAFAAVTMPHNVFRRDNGVRFGFPGWTINHDDYEVAQQLVSFAPNGDAVAAPEAIAVWIPTFVERPPIIMVREMYAGMLEPFRSDVPARVLLQQAISGRQVDEGLLVLAINRLKQERHLGAIAVAGSARDALAQTLSNVGFDERVRFSKYSIFVAEDEWPR